MARRQGREKPTKIEQRKVRGPELRPQEEQTALLAKPNLHRVGPGGGEKKKKTYKKEPKVPDVLCWHSEVVLWNLLSV